VFIIIITYYGVLMIFNYYCREPYGLINRDQSNHVMHYYYHYIIVMHAYDIFLCCKRNNNNRERVNNIVIFDSVHAIIRGPPSTITIITTIIIYYNNKVDYRFHAAVQSYGVLNFFCVFHLSERLSGSARPDCVLPPTQYLPTQWTEFRMIIITIIIIIYE